MAKCREMCKVGCISNALVPVALLIVVRDELAARWWQGKHADDATDDETEQWMDQRWDGMDGTDGADGWE